MIDLIDIFTKSSQLVRQVLEEEAANESEQKPPSNWRMRMRTVFAKPSYLPSLRPLAMGAWNVQSTNSTQTTVQETLSVTMLSRATMVKGGED